MAKAQYLVFDIAKEPLINSLGLLVLGYM